MRVVVDMNLSPLWCDALGAAGHDAVHWSAVGPPGAADDAIMAWARAEGRVVLTHDLDFGAILWATNAVGPSVIQLRGDDVLPDVMAPAVVLAMRNFEPDLAAGALLVVEPARARVRILPLR